MISKEIPRIIFYRRNGSRYSSVGAPTEIELLNPLLEDKTQGKFILKDLENRSHIFALNGSGEHPDIAGEVDIVLMKMGLTAQEAIALSFDGELQGGGRYIFSHESLTFYGDSQNFGRYNQLKVKEAVEEYLRGTGLNIPIKIK